jgi:hypothetical protein
MKMVDGKEGIGREGKGGREEGKSEGKYGSVSLNKS